LASRLRKSDYGGPVGKDSADGAEKTANVSIPTPTCCSLGELLTLIHNSDTRWHRFAGEFRDWLRPEPSTVLTVTRKDGPRPRWQGAGPFPKAVTIHRRIRAEQPDRIRVEMFHGRQLVRVGVRSGDRWCRWDVAAGLDEGQITEMPDPTTSPPPLLRPPLLSPTVLVPTLRFEPVGVGTVVGRDVVIARATPRVRGLSPDARSYEFSFDSCTGIVLRRTRMAGDTVLELTEALSAAFDGGAPPTTFDTNAPLPQGA
jgi:hypothetical protein